ncbi:MAG: VWA domain-containing protein, partial [Bacteroidota bacterium]
ESYTVGDTIDFSFRISGTGKSNLIQIPENGTGGFKILTAESSNDTLRYDKLRARKTFDCKLIFTKPGSFDLSEIFSWNYYSIKEQQVKKIGSKRRILVEGAGNLDLPADTHSVEEQSIIIALDVSQSMLIEDLKPNRLKAIEMSLTKFLEETTENPQIILYSGRARKAELSDINTEFDLERGTAIGSAILEAIDLFQGSTHLSKQLIIIGDGDNTAGFISPEYASKVALEAGITIHTIGIGTTGSVPFGEDFFGRTRMIENTYQSASLRKIADLTGGTFHEYESNDSFQRVLRELLSRE